MANKQISLKSIQKEVENQFKLELTERRRQRTIIYPRAIYYYLARKHTGNTLQEIADSLGFNHSGVINALRNTMNDIQYEPVYRDYLKYIDGVYSGKETLEQENERLKEEIRVLTMKNRYLREA